MSPPDPKFFFTSAYSVSRPSPRFAPPFPSPPPCPAPGRSRRCRRPLLSASCRCQLLPKSPRRSSPCRCRIKRIRHGTPHINAAAGRRSPQCQGRERRRLLPLAARASHVRQLAASSVLVGAQPSADPRLRPTPSPRQRSCPPSLLSPRFLATHLGAGAPLERRLLPASHRPRSAGGSPPPPSRSATTTAGHFTCSICNLQLGRAYLPRRF
jgi:hypothetical protein